MTSVADRTTSPPARQHYGVTFAVLALAGASYSMLQSTVAPALPVIQDELHASSTATAWVFTGYLQTAVATGMNTVMRTLGGSVGGLMRDGKLPS